MECLEYRNVKAALRKIARTRKRRGTRTDHRNAVTVLFRLGDLLLGMLHMIVRDKALETADADTLALYSADALRLALCLLRTYSAAYGGKRACLGDHAVRALEIPLGDLCDKRGNVYPDRASGDARHIPAVKTPLRLVDCLLLGVSESDLVEVARTHLGRLGGHFILFRRHVRHQFSPPFFRRLQTCSRAAASSLR